MRLKGFFPLFIFVFILSMYQSVWGNNDANNLTYELKSMSANRDSEDALSLVLFMLGEPKKTFRYLNYDVWFYPELSTPLVNKFLKNVYIFIDNGKIVFIKTYNQALNPYTEFDSYR